MLIKTMDWSNTNLIHVIIKLGNCKRFKVNVDGLFFEIQNSQHKNYIFNQQSNKRTSLEGIGITKKLKILSLCNFQIVLQTPE